MIVIWHRTVAIGASVVVLVTVDHTPMTVHVSGADGGTGVALVEAYDVGPADPPSSVPN